jgi:hypothetical protein
VFGFAACGAWICRLRHLSFACACACLALDLFVLVFFLFACGARTSSVQMTLASHWLRYIVGGKTQATRSCLSHIDLLQRQRLQGPAAVVGK